MSLEEANNKLTEENERLKSELAETVQKCEIAQTQCRNAKESFNQLKAQH